MSISEPTTALARLDPQALLIKAVESKADIDTLERLTALATEINALRAREAWYDAMACFQAECPPVKKTKTAKIVSAKGNFSYSYAPLDQILSVASRVLGKYGLSISWSQEVSEKTVTAEARVAHAMGHVESSGKVVIPITLSEDGRGASPAQRVGIAMSYAKRYAALSILGLAPEDDTDGGEGTAREMRQEPEAQADNGGHGDQEVVISEAQAKRFFAIAKNNPPESGGPWTNEQLHDLLAGYKISSSKDIPVSLYNRIIDSVKLGPAEGLKPRT